MNSYPAAQAAEMDRSQDHRVAKPKLKEQETNLQEARENYKLNSLETYTKTSVRHQEYKTWETGVNSSMDHKQRSGTDPSFVLLT